MAKKFDYKAIIRKFSYARSKDPLKVPLRPYRDWGFLLACFFVILVAVSIASAYLFIEINREEIFSKELAPEGEIEMLNLEALKGAIKSFDDRAEVFETLRGQKPGIVDPSL